MTTEMRTFEKGEEGHSPTKGLAILGAGALLLLVLIVVRKDRGDSPPPPGPSPRTAGRAPERPLPSLPVQDPPRVEKPGKAPAMDPLSTLNALAEAIEKGDQKAARLLLESLRAILFPSSSDRGTAADKYGQALDILSHLVPNDPGKAKEIREALRSDRPTDSERELLRGWLTENKESLRDMRRLLVEASGLPPGVYARNPDGEPFPPAPLSRLQDAAHVLCANALLLEEGAQSEVLRALLSLPRAFECAPQMISKMVEFSVRSRIFDALQGAAVLGAGSVEASIDPLNPPSVRDGFVRSLLGEAYWSASTLLKMQEEATNAPDDNERAELLGGFLDHDVAAHLRAYSDFARLAQRPYYEVQGELEAYVRLHGENAAPTAPGQEVIATALAQQVRLVAMAEAQESMVEIARSLESYRGANGDYPSTLDAVSHPLPPDPFTGRPFRYRKEGAGFVLEAAAPEELRRSVEWKVPR